MLMFWYDWDDIIDFDYVKFVLCCYMIQVLLYWVCEVGIDGYCVDVVGFMLLDFWEQVVCELRVVKLVFLFVEWESCDLYVCVFDVIYVWSWWDMMKFIVEGCVDVIVFYFYYVWN